MMVQNAEAVCIATGSWTSINNDNFVAVTAHFFDISLEINSTLFECIKFSERHTAENLSEQLIDIVKNYNIENKIEACTTDNAANIVAAVRNCNWRRISCFAHTLNLIVQEALREIHATTGKVKSIVEYFKRCSHALSMLQTTQEQMTLPKLKLIQDVAIRWNSTFAMLRRILELKEALISTLATLQLENNITINDWKVIEKAVEILKTFLDVTLEVSAEKSITIPKVIPLVKIMKKKLINYQLMEICR
ncbi:hypothetical protein NQ314_001813 [Rhamnusium bicolor]|uniref:Uncharacterized protein n=1 Tax=Rhamnusium bicolor TaxID=1586634 RepID=A0AAV8ZT53_9CUCU|nr:hypothetical protein NQ314_001813 [Rhamnusium bicolor]